MGDRSTRSRNVMVPPPPYESAVYRQLWPIVAPFLQPGDLYSACLVSRDFHKIFAPQLWGAPGNRFGTTSDTIYLSITRFKRLLVRARLDVRRLSHTLHIPPAQPEFYGGPQAGWLRDILDRLPSLQALVVSNLSFFDHQALQRIHRKNEGAAHEESKYGLRLLIASECENTTSASLVGALLHFPDLIYLDLSSAQGSRNHFVLQQIGTLTQLRVLKLRSCGLRDYDIDSLSFSSMLRSLDVSDNYLTERGVLNLINRLPAAKVTRNGGSNSSVHENTPHPRRQSISKRPSLQNYVSSKLTSGPDGHLYIDEGLPPTFADLYLAGNFLTIDELSKALSYPNIEFLDCGSLNCSQRPQELLSPGSPGSDRRRLSTAEIDKLSPAVFTEAFRNIRSLRIHHSVITSRPFFGKDLPISEQCFELHSEDLRYELDSSEITSRDMVFELDDTSVNNAEVEQPPKDGSDGSHPTFETPDDVGAGLSLPSSEHLEDQQNGSREVVAGHPQLQAGSNMSRNKVPPKLILPSTANLSPFPKPPVIHPPPIRAADHPPALGNMHPPISVPTGPERFRYNYTAGEEQQWREAGQNGNKAATTQEIIEEVQQRRHRTAARERHPGRFKPSMLPNLKTLTLTDVPPTTRRQSVIDALILFIQECAEEEEVARLEDLIWETNQEGQRKDRSVGGIFKLQRLVLEMSSAPDPVAPPRSPREKRNSFTKSSTEDPDSEMFMEATESDFSFFDEDDGDLLVGTGRLDPPIMVNDGMIVDDILCSPTDTGHSMDLISELSGFRRERKIRHEAAVKYGSHGIDNFLLGHWRGEVKVVKNLLVRD